MASSAQAQIINLASFNTANPDASTNPTIVSFGPGTYSVKTIGTAQGGQYDGWRIFNVGGYDERYGITYDGSTTQVWPNPSKLYDTTADALAAYANIVTTFTLDKATDVAFQITDSWYYDNAGGVSLQITPTDVPEPPTLVLFAAAVGGALFLRRRRAAAA